MFGALSDSLKFILQFFILLLKFLHSSQNILDFYVIFQRLIHFFQLNHQETLAVNRHLNDAVDVLSFMLTLEQKIENQFDGLTDGVVLREESLVGSVHLLPLHLHQKVLQLSEIGLEVEHLLGALLLLALPAALALVEHSWLLILLSFVEFDGI